MGTILDLAAPLADELANVLTIYRRAYDVLKETKRRIQIDCPHPHLVEADTSHSSTPMRLCSRCRYWESSKYHYSSYTVLCDTEERIIIPIARDTLYALRLP